MSRSAAALFALLGPLLASCGPSAGAGDRGGARDAETTREAISAATPLSARVNTAMEMYRRGEYEVALVLLDSTRSAGRRNDDAPAVARSLTLEGLIAYRMGDLSLARDLSRQALDLKLEIGLKEELSRSYNTLGLIAWSESRLSDAMEMFRLTSESADPADDRTRAVVAINRGLVQSDLGRFDSARVSFRTARDLTEAIDDVRLEAVALTNMGMLETWTGNARGALELLDRARLRYDSVAFAPGELNVLGQLGTAHLYMGEIGSAIAVLDTAITLSRDLDMRQEEASNLELLAGAYAISGQHRAALDLYSAAEEIYEGLGLALEQAHSRRYRAEIYLSLGEPDLALPLARSALEGHEAAGADWRALGDLILLAVASDEVGVPGESQEYLARATRLAETFGARSGRARVALAGSRIMERRGDYPAALALLDDTSLGSEAGGYDLDWEADMLRARAYRGLGAADSAIAAARRSVAAVDRVRASLRSGGLRVSYGGDRQRAYETLITLLLDQGSVREAFEVAAAARSTAVNERLGDLASRADPGDEALATLRGGESVLRRIAELEARVAELERTPATSSTSTGFQDLLAQLARSRSEYEEIRLRASESDPLGAALLGANRVTSADIMSSLIDREVLVQFFVGEERSVGFVVTRGEVHSYEIPATSRELRRRVRLSREILANAGLEPEAADEVLSGLHELLLAPGLRLDEVRRALRLVIVPQGVLAYLPFAALRDPDSRRYLGQDYVLLTEPSSAAIAGRLSGSDGSSKGMSAAAFAPFPHRLPGTIADARAVRAAFSDVRVHEGRRATERRVREALGEEDIVHLSTHAVLNARNALFSRVELAHGSDARDDDGRLEVYEVLELQIGTRLVYLAGCETGRGAAWSTEHEVGDDFTTLSLAFLYAGAENVVATLWPVEDTGASVFTERFYRELVTSDPPEALAAAQRAMLSDPRYSSPYHWAAYQIAGSGGMNAQTPDGSV